MAALILWPAPASDRLSAAESALPSVGPACREQPRPADVMRTAGVSSGVVVAIATTVDWEPVKLVADLRDTLGELEWATDQPQRVAQNEAQLVPGEPNVIDPNDKIVQEQVPVGQLERDPCYVNRPITEVGAGIAPTPGVLPENVALKCADEIASLHDPRMTGGWSGFDKHWAATCFCHAPLYFEEVNAERYGYSAGYVIQPVLSAGRFLATIPALPYLMVANPPCECVYTLGHYRPGSNCVPWRNHRPAWCVGAGITQAVVVVGLVALIP